MDKSKLLRDIPPLITNLGSPSALYGVPFVPIPDRRSANRYLVKWRAKVYQHEHEIHEGITNDLSSVGASIFLDQNLCCKKGKYKVLLTIPPATGLPNVRVAEAEARLVYSILDSKHKRFRVAFEFLSFNHGKQVMMDRLAMSGAAPNFKA